MTDIREANDILWHLDAARKDVVSLLARNELLEPVLEAAGEYLYDTSKRQGLFDAYLAVQTVDDQNPAVDAVRAGRELDGD